MICSKCKADKPADDFVVRNGKLRGFCKKCNYAWRKAWSERNPEKHAYNLQKCAAKRRGIPWELTFEQFVEFWGEDFALRGKDHEDLCMCRIGDEGPYAIGNIVKATVQENRLRLV